MADLSIRITVDNAEANRKLAETDRHVDNIEGSAQEASKSVGSLEASLSKVGAVAAGVAALKVGFEGVSRVVGQSVTSYSAQEDAVTKLTAALRAQGTYTPELIQQYGAMASQFQATTVFADDLTNDMQALLVQVGNVMPDQMQRALDASMNLSAGLGVDLRTATLLVGKAFAGETSTLTRYGIVIDEAALKTDAAAATVDAINAKFGGQAQAQLETYSGRMALFRNTVDDLKEAIGGAIASAITPLLNLFLQLPTPIQNITIGGGLLLATLGPLALGFAAISSAVGPLIPLIGSVLGGAVGILTGAFATFATFITGTILPMFITALPLALRGLALLLTPPTGLVIAGILAVVAIWRNWDQIGPIVQRVYEAVKTWLVDRFNGAVESIRQKVGAVTGFFRDMYDKVVGNSYVPDMIDGIEAQFARLPAVMVGPTEAATLTTTDAFRTMQSSTLASLSDMSGGFDRLFGTDIAGIFQRFDTGPLGGLLAGIENAFGPRVSGAISKFKGFMQDGFTAVTGIGRAFMGDFSGVVDGVMAGIRLIKNAWSGIKSLFGGGEEGTVVNPARDAWFGGRSVDDVGRELGAAGLDGNMARELIENVFNARTKSSFDAASGEIDRILGKAHTGGFLTAAGLRRYHMGGLLEDERAIIAETGEGILSRRGMAALGEANLHALNQGGDLRDPELRRELQRLRRDNRQDAQASRRELEGLRRDLLTELPLLMKAARV